LNHYVVHHIESSIATVTIVRPNALNALNKEVIKELEATIDFLEQEDDVKVIILTGAGDKAFVAGADISEMRAMTPMEAKQFSTLGHQVFDRLEKSRLFTIAAVNGFALGGGCELAMACDMRVASERSKLGIPEVTLGLIPGFGGTQRLPRLVGLGKAKEMLATGGVISAEYAKEIGLVNHVVIHQDVMSFCIELAKKIASNSTDAISLGKQAMNRGTEMDQDKAMSYEASLFAVAFTTPDAPEGMQAFLEKRSAVFQ